MRHAHPSRKDLYTEANRPESSKTPFMNLSQPQQWMLRMVTFTFMVWLLFRRDGKGAHFEAQTSVGPPVVLVTVTDAQEYGDDYVQRIKDNREQYAATHGYSTLIVPSSDYNTGDDPKSWAKLMAARHALAKYPTCGFVWLIDQNALIMEPRRSLEDHILGDRVLETAMQPEAPVVPGSIVKTSGHLRAEDADLIISQDARGLVTDSVIVRRGEWAKFFLEHWLDPLYRSYRFEKAENHALEHSVQSHPTVLSKLALVPQRLLASYTTTSNGTAYTEGDFVVLFDECNTLGQRSCVQELDGYWARSSRASETQIGAY